MITFKGRHTPQSITLQCVRWLKISPHLPFLNIEKGALRSELTCF